MLQVRSRRATFETNVSLLLWLDCRDAISLRQGNGPPAFDRSTDACKDWVVPAVLAGGADVSRHHADHGVLIERARECRTIKNTFYDPVYWSATGQPFFEVTHVASPALYENDPPDQDKKAIRLTNSHELPNAFYQASGRVLTAKTYQVACLAYKGAGQVPTSADIEVFASTVNPSSGLSNQIASTAFEPIGDDVYLAWGTFTASATTWYPGVVVKVGKTMYVNVITCARFTTQAGAFAGSLVPNTTIANLTHSHETLTVPTAGNVDLDEGTLEVRFTPRWSDAQHSGQEARIVESYVDSSNQVIVRAATDGTWRADIGNTFVSDGTVIPSRGTPVTLRATWRVGEKTRLYVNGSPKGVSSGALAAMSSLASNLNIGCSGGANFHADGFVEYLRIWNERREP